MKNTAIAVFAAMAATVALGAGTGQAQDNKFISIGTGGVTGVYYPAGGAICRLVNQGRVEQDQKTRERLYLDAQRILIDDEAVIIPLYYEPNMALVCPRVQGLELNPMNYLYLRKLNVRP